jgi:hypothetical protein
MEVNSKEGVAVSISQAASDLGTTPTRILMLMKEGVLVGYRENDDWFITRESIECFQSHGGDEKSQVSCRTSCGGSCGRHGRLTSE